MVHCRLVKVSLHLGGINTLLDLDELLGEVELRHQLEAILTGVGIARRKHERRCEEEGEVKLLVLLVEACKDLLDLLLVLAEHFDLRIVRLSLFTLVLGHFVLQVEAHDC